MGDWFQFEISKVADTLISQATMFNCNIEKAWTDYMHPLITDQFTFDEVKTYIADKAVKGQDK